MKSVRETLGGLGNLMFKQAYLIGQAMDGVIPDVYVQSSKYWAAHKQLIKDTFGQDIGHTDMVALHIRRGDYLQHHDFHKNLWDTDYYQKAVALFPNERFLVFCKDNQSPEQDKVDRQWCRENLPALLGNRFEMAPYEDSEIEDLNLMASCKSIIMANSSFSFWAAFLSKASGANIICPPADKWFVDGRVRTELEREWTIIPL